MRQLWGKLAMGLLATTMLQACGNPYALKVNSLNYEAEQKQGSITYSDPKVFRREALINERRGDATFLNKQLQELDDGKLTFSSEVTRELQSITSFSAALGLAFDPAAGRNYERASEVADIKQEIEVTRLQMALDQLRRDAELLREKLAKQETPSDPPSGGTPGTAEANAPNPGSAEALVRAITALEQRLNTQLQAAAAPLSNSSTAASPFDTFRDHTAYRTMVNSALSSASLDELHDRDGGALVRLTMSATVLPEGEKYLDTLGLLHLKVVRPKWKYRDMLDSYKDWLSFVNASANRASRAKDGRLVPSAEFTGVSVNSDLGEEFVYYFPQADSAAKPKAANAGSRRTTAIACDGLSPQRNLAKDRNCRSLVLFAPRIGVNLFDGANGSDSLKKTVESVSWLGQRDWQDSLARARLILQGSPHWTAFSDPKVPARCPDGALDSLANLPAGGLTVDGVVTRALQISFARSTLSSMEQQARVLAAKLVKADLSDQPYSPYVKEYLDATHDQATVKGPTAERATFNDPTLEFVNFYIQFASKRCGLTTLDDSVFAQVPYRYIDAFMKTDSERGDVRIYEVGPRQQVQQMTSMARAAEAIGLAASVAGKVPGSGLGLDGNVAFSRSATGKVDMLERLPLISAFTEAGDREVRDGQPVGIEPPAFGWLMGPSVSLDAKEKELKLEHRLKPYDLSVDLVVPGWWPRVEFDASTSWAPEWGAGKLQPLANSRRISVPLAPTSADYAALTKRLIGASALRTVRIDRVVPDRIGICKTDVTLQITGENIWRADKVFIGGREFTGATVLPDMAGIQIKLTSLDLPVIDDEKAILTVPTPYGHDDYAITVVECPPAKTDKPAK